MLEKILVTNIFAFLLVFSRVGGAILLMPGFSEAYVNMRARLLLALAVSFVLVPLLEPLMPPIPDSAISLTVLILQETLVGISIGMVSRFIISALHVAGQIISAQSSLSIASQFDMSQTSQGTAIGNFLSITAITVMFASNQHYVMLRAISDSYGLFAVAEWADIQELQGYFTHLLGDAFAMGLQLSMPIVVMSLLLYLGAGVLSRLMPNIQIFSIIMPPQILLGFVVWMTVFTAIILQYTQFFEATYEHFMDIN